MGIALISISHKVAPLAVRELFAFSEEKQSTFMKDMLGRGIASECVMISTCNRTEVYAYTDRSGVCFTKMQNLLFEYAGAARVEHMVDYVRFYQDSKAVAHLFPGSQQLIEDLGVGFRGGVQQDHRAVVGPGDQL